MLASRTLPQGGWGWGGRGGGVEWGVGGVEWGVLGGMGGWEEGGGKGGWEEGGREGRPTYTNKKQEKSLLY